jgi:glycine oxidase
VSLLDPREIGHGASRASAGMLVPFTEGRHDQALQALGALSLSRYESLVEALAAEGAAVPFARRGSLDVACDDAGEAALDEYAEALARAGIACERLDRAALRALEPSLTEQALAGLRIPGHGAVGVPELVAALWRSAMASGAVHVQARAGRIRQEGSRVRVETPDGIHVVRHVVLAAGSWAGKIDIEGIPPLPVEPVRGQLLALRSDAISPAHTLWGPGCYAVPWPDGTLLVGATAERVGFDERATVAGVRGLLDAIANLLPGIAGATLHDVRVGLRPATPDDRPIIGASARIDGLVYATGHYRNGALLAPITAEAVAALVDGTPLDPVWAPCAPGRFGAF